MTRPTLFPYPERERWTHLDPHKLALDSTAVARRQIAADYAARNSEVESRAFRPYVYHTIEGAGTGIESALREGESLQVVHRGGAHESRSRCLAEFEGYRAGAALPSAGALVPTSQPRRAGAEQCAPETPPPGASGMFGAGTRPCSLGAGF